ncbi:hypothetical protein MMPV_007669 [Pyropia vietnamensis]
MEGQPLDQVGSCVELSLKASGLPNMDYFSLSDPFIIISTPGIAPLGAQFAPTDEVLGQTETCWDNLDPKFVRKITLDANTPLDMPLIITVYDRDSKKEALTKHDHLGAATTTLRAVMESEADGLNVLLRRPSDGSRAASSACCGTVTIMAETIDDTASEHSLTIDMEPLAPRQSGARPYLVICRQRGDNSWQPIYRSPVPPSIHKWSPERRLKEGDPSAEDPAAAPSTATLRTYRGRGCLTDTPLRFELWAHEKSKPHQLLGTAQLSLGSLRRQAPGKHLVLSHMGVAAAELVFRSVAVKAADASTFGLVINMDA